MSSFPLDITSKHYSNGELRRLHNLIERTYQGNVLTSTVLERPDDTAIIAEIAYRYRSFDDFAKDLKNEQIMTDGLTSVFRLAFIMKEKHKK